MIYSTSNRFKQMRVKSSCSVIKRDVLFSRIKGQNKGQAKTAFKFDHFSGTKPAKNKENRLISERNQSIEWKRYCVLIENDQGGASPVKGGAFCF